MKIVSILRPLVGLGLLAGVAGGAYLTRSLWHNQDKPELKTDETEEVTKVLDKIIVNEQAQKNLGIEARKLEATSYWKTLQIPGMVVDRAGFSDRAVVALATGVVTKIHHVPGDEVRTGEPLFTLKLLSEAIQTTQSDLFKTTRDIAFAQVQRNRLKQSPEAIAASQITEVENQIARFEVLAKAYRQELLNRGFDSGMIEQASQGRFTNELRVLAPPVSIPSKIGETGSEKSNDLSFELQELKVDLGQQVQAGQSLCTLANHRYLAIEGRAFSEETPLLERSVKERWPIEVDFQEEAKPDWGELRQSFRIRWLSNTIDQQTRTFTILIPLENESRTIEDEGYRQTLWRFRPGQRVRIQVRVEELKNVFVLPADAVTTEGTDAYIFTQNVNTFTRRPVRVVHRERSHVVIENDGSLPSGTYAIQAGAAQLNRMLKSSGSSGVPKGYHVHADGSLHKNEDEGK